VVKYRHIKIKPRICVGLLFILCLTQTETASSLKQNITVIKEMCSWLPPFCKQNLLLFIRPRWQLRRMSSASIVLRAELQLTRIAARKARKATVNRQRRSAINQPASFRATVPHPRNSARLMLANVVSTAVLNLLQCPQGSVTPWSTTLRHVHRTPLPSVPSFLLVP